MTLMLALNVPASVGDPSRTRTVYAAILFLVALGVVLLAVAMWLARSTRHDPEVLAPLELMGQRRWRKADPVFQRRRLDEVRPPGAQPLTPAPPMPVADESFDRVADVTGFEDLVIDPTAVAPSPEPEPEPASAADGDTETAPPVTPADGTPAVDGDAQSPGDAETEPAADAEADSAVDEADSSRERT